MNEKTIKRLQALPRVLIENGKNNKKDRTMTDKQIIDGERIFKCVWCKDDFKESDANFILSENPNECVCSGCMTEWADNLLCDLKRKEQECEELKEKVKKYGEINEQETKDYAELKAENEELKKANKHIEHNRNQKADKLMRIEKLIIACLTGYTDEFIQELLVILHEPEPNSFENKHKAILAEIKEIAETEIECKTYEIENDCFNETRCKALNEHIDFIKQILQKISECKVENE